MLPQPPDDPCDFRRVRVIGLDALVPVVAPQNADATPFPCRLSQVFSRRDDNWQAFGGPDAPIALHCSNARVGPAQGVRDPHPARDRRCDRRRNHPATPAPSILPPPWGGDAYALGITSAIARGMARSLPLSGRLRLFSQAADANAVKARINPLTGPCFFVYLGRDGCTACGDVPRLDRDRDPAEACRGRGRFVKPEPDPRRCRCRATRLANARRRQPGEGGGAWKTCSGMVETLDGGRAPVRRTFRFRGRVDRPGCAIARFVARWRPRSNAARFDGRR